MSKKCEECIVCKEPGNLIVYNHCGVYSIHRECLDNWLYTHQECIICRETITTVKSKPPERRITINTDANLIAIRNEYHKKLLFIYTYIACSFASGAGVFFLIYLNC